MKLLLYCTKAKPYLYKTKKPMIEKKFGDYHTQLNEAVLTKNLNGKIVAECDFEVEEITYELYGDLDWQHDYLPTTNTLSICSLEDESCLTRDEMDSYLKGKNGYAIHIRNLNIFYTPKELSECEHFTTKYGGIEIEKVKKAPQNMMMAMLTEKGLDDYVLVSIRPEWLCKILNEEKTIEVRKKVLKEMIK